MAVVLLLFLFIAVVSGQSFTLFSKEPNEGKPFNQTVTDKINYIFPKDKTLDSIKESVITFIHKVEDLSNEINDEKTLFLENLEDEKVVKMLRMFSEPPCEGKQPFEQLKKSFILRFGLLETSLSEAMSELQDKVNEMKRSFDLERVILDVKLTTCELMDMGSHCANTSVLELPCLNDTCSPPEQNIESIIFPLSKSADHNYISDGLSHTSPLSTDCEGGKFRCLNGQCIQYNYVCDGSPDCSDGSDENSECSRECSGKRCRNLVCISDNQICNGVDDCGDRTDEENCVATETCNLKNEKFACLNKKICMPLSSLCDRKPDCSDNSDEGRNCSLTNGCGRCADLGGACLRTPSGPLCLSSCPSGFVFDSESGVCASSDSTSGKRAVFKNYSFFGSINKIKVLFKRLSNGFGLMKKKLNQEMIRMVKDLNNCVQKNNEISRSPFEILV